MIDEQKKLAAQIREIKRLIKKLQQKQQLLSRSLLRLSLGSTRFKVVRFKTTKRTSKKKGGGTGDGGAEVKQGDD